MPAADSQPISDSRRCVTEGAIGKLQFRSRNSKAFSVGGSKMTMWNTRLPRRQCFKRDKSNLKLNAVVNR